MTALSRNLAHCFANHVLETIRCVTMSSAMLRSRMIFQCILTKGYRVEGRPPLVAGNDEATRHIINPKGKSGLTALATIGYLKLVKSAERKVSEYAFSVLRYMEN